MPEKTQSILEILGANKIALADNNIGKLKSGAILGNGKSPFPRIDSE